MNIKKIQQDILGMKLDSILKDEAFPVVWDAKGNMVYIGCQFFGFVIPKNLMLIGDMLGEMNKQVTKHFDTPIQQLETLTLLDETRQHETAEGKPCKLRIFEDENGRRVYANSTYLERYWNPKKCQFAHTEGKWFSAIMIFEDEWRLTGIILPVRVAP